MKSTMKRGAGLGWMGLVLLWSGSASATCWTPDLREDTGASAHPWTSKVISLEWDRYDSACDSVIGSFDHYRVERDDSCLSSWDVGDGTLAITASPVTNNDAWHTVWYAEWTNCYAVFACNASESACTGSADMIDYTASLSTEAERWVAVSVDDHLDTDRVGDTTSGGAAWKGPAVLRVPENWSSGDEDKLALFTYDEDESAIYMQLSQSDEWEDWNTATFDTRVLVAQSASAPSASGDYWTDIGYPWVAWASLGTGTNSVLLATQLNQNSIGTEGGIGIVLGASQSVEDLDIECTEPSDTGADCELSECENGDACDYDDDSADGNAAVVVGEPDADFTHYAHGRFVDHDVKTSKLDLCTKSAQMVFTAVRSGESNPGDIFVMESTGPGTSTCDLDEVTWDVVEDGSGDPLKLIDDYHDPFTIPVYKGGPVRIYAKESCNTSPPCGDYTAFYSRTLGKSLIDDPVTGDDHSSVPEFFFDDGSTAFNSENCVTDPDGIWWAHSAGNCPACADKGIFAWRPNSVASCTETADAAARGSVIFFELEN